MVIIDATYRDIEALKLVKPTPLKIYTFGKYIAMTDLTKTDHVVSLGTNGKRPISMGDPDTMVNIKYTSGSTGKPKVFPIREFPIRLLTLKGVMIQNNSLNRELSFSSLTSTRVTGFCHAPLSHSARINLLRTLGEGGRVGIYGRVFSEDIFEDCRLLQPTSISFVPRIWDLLFSKFKEKLEKERSHINDSEDLDVC